MKAEELKMDELIQLVKETKQFVEDEHMKEQVKTKRVADYVTQVDLHIQNFLKERLSMLAPEIQFLGEEEGLHEMTGDSYWILDPIDGTTNLIHDYLHSVVSLGLYHKGEFELGIIYDPYRDEIFYAQRGKGSFRNGQMIHVSEAKTLSDTIIGTGSAPYHKELAEENFERQKRVFLASQDIRRMGSAAMELAYTACGRQGGYFEIVLQPWDYAAAAVILEEAGGRITDFNGERPNPCKPGSIVASNGSIHEELRKLL